MKRINPVDEKDYIACDDFSKFVILLERVNKLISAHNENVDYEVENGRYAKGVDADIKCVGVDNCQEIALLRAQVKRLVEALKDINSLCQHTMWGPGEKVAEISFKALENYKRGGV